MKIELDKDQHLILKEVYNSVIFETDEKSKLIVCMRDFGYEIGITVIDNGVEKIVWHYIEDGKITQFG